MMIKKYIIAPIIVTCISCNGLIEYSPYDSNISTHNYNETNVDVISNTQLDNDTLKFALISDSHDYYDDLSDAIDKINSQDNLLFVLVCGDVTNTGLSQEYEWYLDIIDNSKYPVITVIGNHDYLSNGSIIYQRLFGSSNTSFTYGSYKFILFDDIVWENNNAAPDFDWLATELSDTTRYNIVATHIPPWTDQLEGDNNLLFTQTVRPENTILCLHGHEHAFEELTYNGIYTIVSGTVKDRGYNVISLVGNKTYLERINF
jgi:3',5'-cyclic-AMP phosphodiesterase